MTDSSRDSVPPPPEAVAPLETFASRLDYLFRTVHPQGQRSATYDRVAEVLASEYGIEISANYIWMLRSGRRDNPTLRHIEGLSKFFGVSPAFLSDQKEADRLRSQLDGIKEVADSGVQHVAMRGSDIDESTVDAIRALLARAQDLTAGLRSPQSGNDDQANGD